ncbi:hypothetical protein RhiJN_08004 [Ceratobasidium sp. AG-Ba]|nr:hypothetical protein RhiJN_07989 [Ceratobasidium sp. AG-Ba]QRV79989.1 hypothetical protein RhiJN_08004 [Ceratobasidium sp. AG-Ba]
MASTTATSQASLYYTKAGANSTLAAVEIAGIAGKTYTFLAYGEPTPFNPNSYDKLPGNAVYTTTDSITRSTNVNWISVPRSDTIVSLTSPDQTQYVGVYDSSKSARYPTVGNSQGVWSSA